MGSDNSPQKERYLSKDEIKKEADNFIIDLFQKYKNYEGVLSQNDFNRIVNGLIDSSTITQILILFFNYVVVKMINYQKMIFCIFWLC